MGNVDSQYQKFGQSNHDPNMLLTDKVSTNMPQAENLGQLQTFLIDSVFELMVNTKLNQHLQQVLKKHKLDKIKQDAIRNEIK
jgi:ligand-binding SRPBCC domain-containing protein